MYHIVENKQTAEYISSELYKLCSNKNTNDTTKYLLGIVEHPKNGQAAIIIDEEIKIPLHSSGNPEALIDFFGNYIDEAQEESLRNIFHQGGIVALGQIIPQLLKDTYKTKEELEIDGWFLREE